MRAAADPGGKSRAGDFVRDVQVHGSLLPHTVHHPHRLVLPRDPVVRHRLHVHRPHSHRRGGVDHVEELPLQVCFVG